MDILKFSKDHAIIKKQECLTDVFNKYRLDWKTVVGVVGNFPLSNPLEACKIAKEYLGMEQKECLCTISGHRKGYETGIKV